jgi:hypothetical protein
MPMAFLFHSFISSLPDLPILPFADFFARLTPWSPLFCFLLHSALPFTSAFFLVLPTARGFTSFFLDFAQ